MFCIKNWFIRKKTAKKLKALIKAERQKEKLCRQITNLTEKAELTELIKQYKKEQNSKLEEEICYETGHGQNFDGNPHRRCINPFKKCVINRQIEAEKKRAQRRNFEPSIKHKNILFDDSDEMDDAKTKKRMNNLCPKLAGTSPIICYCNNDKWKHSHSIKKLTDCECDNTRKLTRNAAICTHLQSINGNEINDAKTKKKVNNLCPKIAGTSPIICYCNNNKWKHLHSIKKLPDCEYDNTRTDYRQNLCRDTSRQFKNPFKKIIIKRRIKAEKKRAQCIRELKKKLQHLQDIESERADFGEEINCEIDYGQNLNIHPCKQCRNLFRKKQYIQQPKHKPVTTSSSDSDCTEFSKYQPIKEQQIIKTIVQRASPKQKPFVEFCCSKGNYELCEPKIKKVKRKKGKRKKKRLPKHACQIFDNDDDIYEASMGYYKPCNKKMCTQIYRINERHDIECDNRRKLTRNEKQLLKRQMCLAPNKRYFKIFMNESHCPTAKLS